MHSALEQLEEERGLDRGKILEAIETALAAAYKKDYGKRGQIVRAKMNIDDGKVEFAQVKVVVDHSMLKEDEGDENDHTEDVMTADEALGKTPVSSRKGSFHSRPSTAPLTLAPKEGGDQASVKDSDPLSADDAEDIQKVRFNEEHHIMREDARKIRADAEVGDEIVFPLESRDDFGRIAAQTAKQVIIQKIREAEKDATLEEFEGREGEIMTGRVQHIDRGNVYIELGRASGVLSRDEQIPGEHYRQGERVRAYLYQVDDAPRGVSLRLSRSHPKFVASLFAIEAPEIANGVVEIAGIAREAGSRTKLAVRSTDRSIDPVGSCVGQRGVRVSTVISELGGEKIDIIEWSEDPETYIASALSPARILSMELDVPSQHATVLVDDEQFSLAIGRGGQNVRLAAKLTGWKIDIRGKDGGVPTRKETATKNDAPSSTENGTEAGENTEGEEQDNDGIISEEIANVGEPSENGTAGGADIVANEAEPSQSDLPDQEEELPQENNPEVLTEENIEDGKKI